MMIATRKTYPIPIPGQGGGERNNWVPKQGIRDKAVIKGPTTDKQDRHTQTSMGQDESARPTDLDKDKARKLFGEHEEDT